MFQRFNLFFLEKCCGIKENYKLLFYGNGKLVTLIDKTDSLATFRLDDGGDSFWPVTFYLGKRKSSDKLEILFEE